MKNIPRAIFRFYADGFRSMTLGKTLWLIILLKLLVLFAILRPLFFPNHLSIHCASPEDKPAHVATQLTTRAP